MQFKFHSDYRYWEIALAALAAPEIERATIWNNWDFVGNGDPKMTGKPQAGYYRSRWLGNWQPVHIEPANEYGQQIRVGQRPARQIKDGEWDRCEPISYETYCYAFEHGRFPGEIETALPALDHNAPDPGADLRDQIVSLVGTVERYLAACDKPPTDEQANALANYLSLVRNAAAGAESALKADMVEIKKQMDEKRQTWAPSLSALASVLASLKQRLTPYLAQRPGTKLGGQSGNRISLRGQWTARVDDWELVYPQFSEHEKVRAVILDCLRANARSKDRDELAVEGAVYYQEDVVA